MQNYSVGKKLSPVNSEIFTRILFTRIALKDIFGTLKIHN